MALITYSLLGQLKYREGVSVFIVVINEGKLGVDWKTEAVLDLSWCTLLYIPNLCGNSNFALTETETSDVCN